MNMEQVPVICPQNQQQWRQWLRLHHDHLSGVWLSGSHGGVSKPKKSGSEMCIFWGYHLSFATNHYLGVPKCGVPYFALKRGCLGVAQLDCFLGFGNQIVG